MNLPLFYLCYLYAFLLSTLVLFVVFILSFSGYTGPNNEISSSVQNLTTIMKYGDMNEIDQKNFISCST